MELEGGRRWLVIALAAVMGWLVTANDLRGQELHPLPGEQGSENIRIISHLLGGGTDVEIEQELSRPYVYVGRGNPAPSERRGPRAPAGVSIVSLNDLENPRVVYSWLIEDPELHTGNAPDGKYFKHRGRYYYIQSFQFQAGSPDYDLGAIVFDVTGLPASSTVREVARIRAPEVPGGFHNIFAYKHSSGRPLLFGALLSATSAYVYDLEKVVDGEQGRVAEVPRPTTVEYRWAGYHDYYVGYDPATRQDKFYGAGLNGLYVFDVTEVESPKLLTSVTGFGGSDVAHTFTPTPDGRYAVAEMEYRYAPLRIFDLKAGLDGEVKTISRPIGAWTTHWSRLVHNHEVRWPYVFVSGYRDGLQVFNMMDPTNPYTVGYYDTYEMPDVPDASREGMFKGVWGVDIRNADGLIMINGLGSGLWAFKMDGFDGWNGHQWGR